MDNKFSWTALTKTILTILAVSIGAIILAFIILIVGFVRFSDILYKIMMIIATIAFSLYGITYIYLRYKAREESSQNSEKVKYG